MVAGRLGMENENYTVWLFLPLELEDGGRGNA